MAGPSSESALKLRAVKTWPSSVRTTAAFERQFHAASRLLMIRRKTQATELEGIRIMSYLTADKVQTVFSLGCSMAEHAYEREFFASAQI